MAESATRAAVPSPSVAAVERIVAVADPVPRNLQITQCYHDLAVALSARTGGGANWCTFAVWASKQVGRTIRREDMRRTFEQWWSSATTVPVPEARLPEPVRDAILGLPVFDRTSAAVGRGNLTVFEEIAREFARFVHDVVDGTVTVEEFRAGLRPGEPPEGQDLLGLAFGAYHRAVGATDPDVRDEALLLGNVAVGLHEQTRLQPEIREALDAPVVDPAQLRREVLAVVAPAWLAALLAPLGDRVDHLPVVGALVARAVDRARLVGRLVVTEHLMTLALPGGRTLRLTEDLHAAFPATLVELSDPELRTLLLRVDPTPDSTRGTATADWSNLPERVHYIADMFRCLHRDESLAEAPFTPEQTAEIRAGRVPAGRL